MHDDFRFVGGQPVGPFSDLAVSLTSFIGRDAEIEAAVALLEGHRLVTLTGPGGVGKTRLAREVAARQADRYDDGVYWVELATLTDGAAVVEAVAEVVGAPPLSGRVRTLGAFLGDRRALICLDNVEHVLHGASVTVELILGRCPNVTFLLTGREPLGVAGEAVLGVPSLSDDDAVALFVDRARLTHHAFGLDESNEGAIRSIAAHLDGMPLALELAAAWARSLSPQQVEAGLDDRFSLLVRGPRGAQRRQRTLAGSLDWSHALLDDLDRIVFRRLSVFAGTFGLSAALALCADGVVSTKDVLPAIGRLVDKSLVVVEERAGVARYRLLETIRAYATGRLVEANEDIALRWRHLEWYLRFVVEADAARELHADRWRRDLLIEYDNLSAALDFGLAAEDRTTGKELAAALAWFWHFDRRGREGLDFLQQALGVTPDDRSILQARLLTGLALVADTAGPLDVEYDAAARAAELTAELGDEGQYALCMNLLAVGSFYTDFDESWRLCEGAHDAARRSGNTFVLGAARALQAMILHLRDQHADAEKIIDEVTRNALRHHRGVLSTLLAYQADGAFNTGHPDRARELAEQALQIAEPLGDLLRVGLVRSVLGRILALSGDLEGAQQALDPVLQLSAGAEVFIPGLDQAMAVVAMQSGNPAEAIGWLQNAVDSTERGAETWIAGRALPLLGAALLALDREEEARTVLDRAETVARRMQLPAPLSQALFVQAEMAGARPDGWVRAGELHHAALAIRVEHGLRPAQIESLEALARLGTAIKPTPEDARLLSVAEAARRQLGLARCPDQQLKYDKTAALLRDALGETALEQASVEGRLLTLDQGVEYVRRARGRRGRPATGWSSLTPTEVEVARSAALGLSNPEIAAALFMSRGTVKTHLAHIYAKLGVANRTELAMATVGRSKGS